MNISFLVSESGKNGPFNLETKFSPKIFQLKISENSTKLQVRFLKKKMLRPGGKYTLDV